MKALIVPALGLLFLTAGVGAEEIAEPELDRFMQIRDRISSACEESPQGELCQVWLHGVLEGVRATGHQTARMADRWARLYESEDRAHPFAWLARDILHASACSPDALAFVSGFRADTAEGSPGMAEAQVERFCGPIWSEQRLRPPESAPALSLR